MQESIAELTNVINNERTNVAEKIDITVANYLTFLIKNKDLPLFTLSEMQTNTDKTMDFYFIPLKGGISNSVFFINRKNI